jgi:hypothetical protein
MKEQINKIHWTEVNPDDESTFPLDIEGTIMIGYKHNDLYTNYLVTAYPSLELITYYKGLYNQVIHKKLYLNHKNSKLEIVKWAIVDMGDK